MSTYRTDLYPDGRPSKAAARRELEAIASNARQLFGAGHVRATSIAGRTCLRISSRWASEHRLGVAWARGILARPFDQTSNAAASRALGVTR